MSTKKLTASLERLANALESHSFQNQFIDNWGWQGAPFSADDLASMSRQIASDIQQIEWIKLDANGVDRFADLATRVDKVTTVTIPSFAGGYMALDVIMNTLIGVEILARGLISKDVLHATLKSAFSVGRRIQHASDRLDTSIGKIDSLEATTARIIRAADAAEKLDLTTQELDEAIKQATTSKEMVLKSQLAAEESVRAASQASDTIRTVEGEAVEIMKKINSAYGAATTF